MLLLGAQLSPTPDRFYEFTTEKYAIEMRVSFPAPYEGKRLALYRSADPRKEICPSISGAAPGCVENFVGAVAVVEFTVARIADHRPASASIREVVNLVDQSPGLPERPPYAMSIALINGNGSDIQAFGYDESPLAGAERAAERQSAKAAWRRLRQELYLDRDRQPFALLEWRHTTTGIYVLRVDVGLASVTAASNRVP